MSNDAGGFDLDPELVLEFVADAEEHLDHVDAALLSFERSGAVGDVLGEALRALHSLKGSAGYLNLFDIQALCHSGEELVGSLQEPGSGGEQELNGAFDQVTKLRTELAKQRRLVSARP